MARLGAALCVVPPEPRLNPETGEARKDREGNPVWVVGVAVRQLEKRRADVLEIAVSGEPPGLTEGARVVVVDLVATVWEIDGRHGVSYRASAVRTQGAAPVSAGRGKAASGGDA
ncbi:hypothetical protein [Streptomyces sp. ITFR-6]|uniref:SCO3933 family regulatory protein n=1 Tax=Streptomyces sp. ITFR-6 TaxID=3075197 RepID=UPI00288BD3B4|nr:hypothetical protein [Streptomyces sp. ITFR-6]WNI31374.1 hypothetical protein RLT59_23240 [Streptomyces sp. ITFR-6]